MVGIGLWAPLEYTDNEALEGTTFGKYVGFYVRVAWGRRNSDDSRKHVSTVSVCKPVS